MLVRIIFRRVSGFTVLRSAGVLNPNVRNASLTGAKKVKGPSVESTVLRLSGIGLERRMA